MKITILTDNPNSWIIPYIDTLVQELEGHDVTHVFSVKDVVGGDVMFILSCEKIIPNESLKLHKNNIVVHPSKLPHGKGWSPLAWQILEGVNSIPISLIEAADKVDSGDVYLVDHIELDPSELNEEIKDKQGATTIKMVKEYIANYDTIKGVPQEGEESFYPKRVKSHSELDVNKTIAEQFDLLRVVDNEKYPAHFKMHGKTYIVKVYKEQ